MAYTFNKANANAPSRRKTQYFEMIANRGIYSNGWYANTTPPHGPWILNAPMPPISDYKWELYNLTEDYSQANDLAAKMPGKLKEMQKLFVEEAAKYQVLPLDNRSFARAVEPRPSATAGQTVFTYTGVTPGIPTANSPNVIGRSYKVTAEVDVPQGGGNGMLATTGGRWGGTSSRASSTWAGMPCANRSSPTSSATAVWWSPTKNFERPSVDARGEPKVVLVRYSICRSSNGTLPPYSANPFVRGSTWISPDFG
jgi:hypothetical protein